jgi:glycerol uptake facilitator-like aquaporin
MSATTLSPSSSGQTVAEIGSNPQQLQYIALCFGFSLAVNAWVFFRISGGLFNPVCLPYIVMVKIAQPTFGNTDPY